MLSAMTKEQAIELSIRHWEQVKLIGPNLSSILADSCALCTLYLFKEEKCEGCPLEEIGQKCNTPNSLWENARDVCLQRKGLPAWENACDNMVATLKGCLDAPE